MLTLMNNPRPYRRFKPMAKEISLLKKNNSRFRRVFREYEMISEELWSLENSEKVSVSDDFLSALQQQTYFLEEEIEDWLLPSTEDEK